MENKLNAVFDKVNKLRALAARATTQAEAETAAAQAEQLIAKYQIDEATIEAHDSTRAETIAEDQDPLADTPRRVTWIAMLANGLCKLHGCGCVSMGGDRTRVRVAGRPNDVAIVRYLFSWLRVEIERMADAESGRASKNGFRLGAVAGVLSAMRKARAQEAAAVPGGTGAAMVLVGRADESLAHLKAAIGGRFSTGGVARLSDADAFGRGKAAGEGLSARPGLQAGGRPMLGR